jgi:hypothetical protein
MSTTMTESDRLTAEVERHWLGVRKDEKRWRNWYRLCSWLSIAFGGLTVFATSVGEKLYTAQTNSIVIVVLPALATLFTAIATQTGLQKAWEHHRQIAGELDVIKVTLTDPNADLGAAREELKKLIRRDRSDTE